MAGGFGLVERNPEVPSGLITEAGAKLSHSDLATIRQAIFKDCTESELKLFLHDCQRQGVHPLDRMIHPTVRTDRKSGKRTYTAITSIDLFRSRAEDTGEYAGNDDPIFSGEPKSVAFKASVTVYKIVKGVRCPFTATARWSEYKPEPPGDFMWNRMPCGQLGKCAEALALRKAFPRQLSKLYVQEEMEQAGVKPPPPENEEKIIEAESAPVEPLIVPDQNEGAPDDGPDQPPPIYDPNDPNIVDIHILKVATSNGRGICFRICDPQGKIIGDEDIWWNTFHKGCFDRLAGSIGRHVVVSTSKSKDGKYTNIEDVVG